MSAALRHLIPPLGHLAFVVPLVILSYLQLSTPSPHSPEQPRLITASEQSDEADLPVLSSADSEADIAEIAARPLLAEGRKVPDPLSREAIVPDAVQIAPEVVEIEPVVTPEIVTPEPMAIPDKPNVRLLGTMQKGAQSSALLLNLADETESWAQIGQDYGGWALVEITQDQVRFRFEAEEMTIKLFQ